MTTSLASQAPSEYLEHFSAYQSACEKSLSFCKINKSTTSFHSLYCTLLGQKNDVKMFKNPYPSETTSHRQVVSLKKQVFNQPARASGFFGSSFQFHSLGETRNLSRKNQTLSQASFQHFHAISIVYKSIKRNRSIVKTAVASQR